MHKLIKMSSDGFELYSESLDQILSVLEANICSECFMQETNQEYHAMSTYQQIEELLGTPCGAGFVFCEDAKEIVDNPYTRYWNCQEKMGGFVVSLAVGERESNEFIDRAHWENCLCKPDLLRCVIQRLQRKMFYSIFPTWRGRFNCDMEI